MFQAGSISKPVSALGIMLAVDRGALKLDENVNDELTSWKVPKNAFTAKHPVTLRELLSHTAGTNVHGFEGYERGKPVPTLMQVLDGKPPANSDPIRVIGEPGTKFMYSGGGYTIALQALLDAVHQPFADYMQTNVLTPFGMSSSTFAQPLLKVLWSRAATAYDPDGRPYPGDWHVYPEQTAAGLWTTPSDLARFAIGMNSALHGAQGAILPQNAALNMLTPVKDHYGLGFVIDGDGPTATFGHDGANAGFQALFLMHTAGAQQGVAIMTNSDNGEQLADEVLNAVSDVYQWGDHKPTVKKLYPLPASAEDGFIGTYAVDKSTALIVARRKGVFSIKSPGADWDALYPESPNTFFLLDFPYEIYFTANTLTVEQVGLTAKRVSPK
jgi:CubicO group peptidase (beta-lactamase class C family)